jgi:hypothetical protein
MAAPLGADSLTFFFGGGDGADDDDDEEDELDEGEAGRGLPTEVGLGTALAAGAGSFVPCSVKGIFSHEYTYRRKDVREAALAGAVALSLLEKLARAL